MRRVSFVLVLLTIASFGLAAQQSSAGDQAVRKTIEEHYFKAQSTGNGEALRGTFIEEGRMMWVQNGQLRTRTSTEYISGFRGQPPADEEKRKRRVVMTDVTGDVAVAKVELDFPDALLTDYFTLLKIGDEWKIVHKSFHRSMK